MKRLAFRKFTALAYIHSRTSSYVDKGKEITPVNLNYEQKCS